jgi:hypothetical protein
MNDFITAVQAERERQKATWSGTFDDKQWSALDWKEMIDYYTAFYRRRRQQGRHNEALNHLVQVAALAMAAYEAAQP